MSLPQEHSYLTLGNASKGFFKDKGSKFYGYGFNVSSTDMVDEKLALIAKEHPKARHVCYAYRLGLTHDVFRTNDDGEPSGTAGKPILRQIDSNDLTDTLIAVVRYFGGTLLGTSGLINAYKLTTIDVVENNKIVSKPIEKIVTITFTYAVMPQVMNFVKSQPVNILNQTFEANCSLIVSVNTINYDSFVIQLNKIENLECIV